MKRLLSLLALASALACVTAQAADVKGDVKAGEKKVAMCLGCHNIIGYQASFPEVHKVPMIAGQSPDYIQKALQEYRAGERSHPSMRGIAKSLTDQDIADVAFNDLDISRRSVFHAQLRGHYPIQFDSNQALGMRCQQRRERPAPGADFQNRSVR